MLRQKREIKKQKIKECGICFYNEMTTPNEVGQRSNCRKRKNYPQKNTINEIIVSNRTQNIATCRVDIDRCELPMFNKMY